MSAIPLTIYVTPFAEKGVEESAKWSCDAAREALNVVNTIWSKANLAFVINDCVVDKPLDMAKSARNARRCSPLTAIAPPVRLSRCGCSRQFGRASAPMIPQRVHTMRGPNDGTAT